MTVGANSYGTAAKVAALTRRYTANGTYNTTTNPALATVEGWIDSVSAMLNTILAGAGFSIPIEQADAVLMLGEIVAGGVADLCHAANTTGRFYSEKMLDSGKAPLSILRAEMAAWVEEQADGLELLGAARTRSPAASILYRDTDEAGNATGPIFQRSAFGNLFEDWDA
jgi:hypothetical protein